MESLPNRDEDFDGPEWDEFSWLIPHLVEYGFNPSKFLEAVGPALREVGGLSNDEVIEYLEDVRMADYQKQLDQMKIRR